VDDLLERLKTALADRYTIDREIGSGGMATVYLAEDLKHHRQVALKVLRPELAAALGPDRFLREIEIAANLRHPHILPLYDSGEAEGFLFYVMPYVEGESLRDRLERERQLAIDDTLQVAREVADALSYAHSRGVIHRDIKPENIMLESGHAVVADFGIARAVDAAGGERLTETGIAVGTPAYMSPEQAGGEKELDGRSDLYSLGCVLHEMLAGQPPFTGPTVESLVHQHLTADPPSVTTIRPSVPGWVAAALERSLAKTPADRFNPVAQFGEAISQRTSVTGAEVRQPRATGEHRRLARGALAAALLVVIAVVLYRLVRPEPLTITSSNVVRVTNDPGLEFQPAISPDGNEVAYISGPVWNPRIVVRSTIDVGVGGESRLAEGANEIPLLPAWTPDGASLRFLACEGMIYWTNSGCVTREVGARGGPVRTVDVPRESIRYAWSRDGSRVAFAHWDSIFAFSAGQGEPRLLVVQEMLPGAGGPHSLSWSPDGRQIAYVNGNAAWRNSDNILSASIWVLNGDGGAPLRVTDDEHMDVSPQWLPDSRHLLFVSNRDGQREVFVVEVGPSGPRGAPRKVPGLIDPHSISISADGRRLAYAKFTKVKDIRSIPIPGSGSVSISDAVPITTGNQNIETFSLSPDSEWIVFVSDLRGELDLYKQRVEGGGPELIADIDGDVFEPAWSPVGDEIAFYSSPAFGIYVVSADGGAPDQVVDHPDAGRPIWSPDGLTIAFLSQGPQREGPDALWTVSRDSIGLPWGNAIQVTNFPCGQHDWAPDGASLLCLRSGWWWVRVSREGEELSRFEPTTAGLPKLSTPRFSPDGSRIYFTATSSDRTRGVWWIPSDGGEATMAVEFDDPSLEDAGIPVVGEEHLYVLVAQSESDIYVMDLEW
jgi:serine/threonine-protein kinase